MLKITRDEYPESPRSWDNLGTMVCWHKRYKLGDIQPKESPDSWTWNNVSPNVTVSLPLYLLDHSGITMNTTGFRSCDPQGWDWGRVGIIYVDFDKIRKEWNVKRVTAKYKDKAMAALLAEVKVYDHYLRGEVWHWEFDGPEGADSCGGYYGDSLEETGIAEAIPESAKSLLIGAWEARQ